MKFKGIDQDTRRPRLKPVELALISAESLCDIIGISRKQLRENIRSGKYKPVSLRPVIRFYTPDLFSALSIDQMNRLADALIALKEYERVKKLIQGKDYKTGQKERITTAKRQRAALKRLKSL